MKKLFTHKLFVLTLLSVVVMAAGTAVKNSSSAPASHTNAPGEQNCTACHSGTLNPTPANLTNLTLSIPFTGGGYIPDSTYSITVKYLQSGKSRFGFQITSLSKSGNNPVGSFTAGTGSTKLTGVVLGKTREYITHSGGTGSSSGKGEWTFTWKAPSTNVDSIIFYVAVNAANSDGSTSGDEIYAKTFTVGSSSLLPTASISANKTEVCAGDTVQFMGSGTNSPTGYAWKFKVGNPTTSTAQNPKVVYSIPGTYIDTLRVRNAKGESAPAVITIKVVSAPVANIASVQPANTICAGDTVTLGATFGTGYSYKWNTGNPADTFSTVKVTQQGNYIVTVTNSTGCSKVSAPVAITVNPLPLAVIGTSKNTACEGDTLTVFANVGNTTATRNLYQNGSLIYTGGNAAITATLTQNDTFELTIDDNGCTSLPVTKIINTSNKLAAPTITCGTPTTSSVTFDWATVTGATGYEVSTDSGKTWATPSSGAMGLSHTISGLNFSTDAALWVRATDNAPCLAGNVSNKVCKSLSCSGVTYNAAVADTIICPGDSTIITISNISASNYSLQFNGGAFGTATSFSVKPSQTTKYAFALIDSATLNCPALTFDVDVEVDVLPNVTLNSNVGNTLCLGKTVDFSTNTSSPVTKYTIIANGSPSTLTNSTGVFNGIAINDGDKVAMEVETPAGCRATSNEITFVVNPLPMVGYTATINNRVVDFEDTTSTTMTRVWDFGDNSPTVTTKSPSHTYATVGTFNAKLIVTNGNGCVDSSTQAITTQNLSIGNIAGLNGFEVYPNPTKGDLSFAFEWFGAGNMHLTLMDVNGKMVWNDVVTETGNFKRMIDLSTFADGTYLLRLKTAQGEHTLKVLKTK